MYYIFKIGIIHGHAELEIDITIQGAPPIMLVLALYRVRTVPRDFTSIIPGHRHYTDPPTVVYFEVRNCTQLLIVTSDCIADTGDLNSLAPPKMLCLLASKVSDLNPPSVALPTYDRLQARQECPCYIPCLLDEVSTLLVVRVAPDYFLFYL